MNWVFTEMDKKSFQQKIEILSKCGRCLHVKEKFCISGDIRFFNGAFYFTGVEKFVC